MSGDDAATDEATRVLVLLDGNFIESPIEFEGLTITPLAVGPLRFQLEPINAFLDARGFAPLEPLLWHMASRALGSTTAVEFTVAPGHDQYERTQRAIAMAAAALTILDGGPTRVLAQFVQLAESQRLLSVGVAQPRRTRSALAQRGMDHLDG